MKTHGRYSMIQHEGLQEKLGQLEALEQDVMDLSPEVQLLRTLVIDYVERYEAFSEALIAWHADSGKTSKPRKVMDITDAGNLIEKISRTVHRIHQIHSTGSITLDTFKRVVESMGLIVASHVQEKQVLDSIEQEWSSLALEARDPGLNPAPVRELEDGAIDTHTP
jgi:predicted signal transduction protein with EAL and GGDEF domain